VMGRLSCDADQAWVRLRDSSQNFNIKVRALAVALLEHIGNTPAEQPSSGDRITPNARTRRAAAQFWRELGGA
jgi:hypothetical protein